LGDVQAPPGINSSQRVPQDEVAADHQDLNMMEETAEKTTSTGSARRKPYEKPAFRHERVFETMALSCGKMQGTQGQCHQNRKNS
jgi:hypothetical protein